MDVELTTIATLDGVAFTWMDGWMSSWTDNKRGHGQSFKGALLCFCCILDFFVFTTRVPQWSKSQVYF